MASKKDRAKEPQREPDEYPHAVQIAGPAAMRLFDAVIAGLIADGFTPSEADMLAHLNVDQIMAEYQQQQKKGAVDDGSD